MKNKVYVKASFREILRSKGRFIAIVLIILLGTMLFVGIKAAGPILNFSMSRYVEKEHLSDLQIISTGGLTKEDEALAKKLPNVQIEMGNQLFYVDPKQNKVAKIFSYDPKQKQNRLILQKGRLPKEPTEIVLDIKAEKYGYHLQDTYTVQNESQLKQQTFKIVGFVRSPFYINRTERGFSTVGDGKVDYFAYVPSEAFADSVKTVMYLTFSKIKNAETYSDRYETYMERMVAQAETLFANRPEQRRAEIRQAGEARTAPEKQRIAQALSELQQAGQAAPSPQRADDQQKLIEAQEKITKDEEALAQLKLPSYSFIRRKENPGFQEYGELSKRIAAIANVFPVFFFFIAALITFTTMTRMVEENRREIGTLKALGYQKLEIVQKYVLYALLASSIGIFLGSFLGINALPRIIFHLSSGRYYMDKLFISYLPKPIIQATFAFLFASLGAVLLALWKDLREKPAGLLRPKAPKPGKRIWLEYIRPIWARLSFNEKVSYRNLFRYKARMIMAVIGIAGCAGLLVAGVGLKNSLSSVAAKQFGPIIDYQSVVTVSEADLDARSLQEISEKITQIKQVTGTLKSQTQSVDIQKGAGEKHALTLMIPENNESFNRYVHLKQKNQALKLTDTGAVLTKKIADMLKIKPGDEITVSLPEQAPVKLKIEQITDNYLGTFLYLSPSYYEKITNKKYQPNTFLVQSRTMDRHAENKFSETLLQTGKVINTSFISQQIDNQENSMANLDAIVLIFVVLSSFLAFVVLYNLTNINVSERLRELSTIKVLGFFDKEVTMYIFRENIVFTLIGIVFGWGVGVILTAFILRQASMEAVTFPLVIHVSAYLISAGLTLVFTFVVMGVTHIKLKHIDMIDALKSNE